MYSSLRYFFRLVSVYFKRFKVLIILSLLFGVVVFTLVNRYLIPFLQKEKVVIGVTGKYTASNLPNEIKRLISRGLTKIDENSIVVNDLADGWSVDDEGKVWTFEINNNSYWHDGSKLNSNDLTFDFPNDIVIERPGDSTIVFKLTNKFSPFPSILTTPVFKNGFVGLGDWKVDKLVLGNANYIQQLELINDKGSEIIYKFYPTDERTKLALKLGEVQKIENLLEPKPFDTWNTVSLQKNIKSNQVVTVFFNTQDTALEDKTFRQALNYATNKNNISEDRAISPISPDSYYYNPQVKRYDYDLERARELTKGTPDGELQKIEITLVTSPYLLNIAEQIVKDWLEFGIKANVLVSSIVPTEFQAYLTILDIPSDPDQYPLWHSTQTTTNLSRYNSQRIDKLLEEGRSVTDLEERKAIYIDFQRFLNEDNPAIFISHPVYYSVTKI